jgi:hypothetical protein
MNMSQRCVLSVLCASLAGLAWATDPVAPPCQPGACVPEPAVKRVPKVIFEQKCVDYCLPRCSLLSLFTGCGCGCGDGVKCGQPRVRHALIKKIIYEEVPEVKCVPAPAVPAPPAASPPR